jgi:hypothetical protein
LTLSSCVPLISFCVGVQPISSPHPSKDSDCYGFKQDGWYSTIYSTDILIIFRLSAS